MRALFAMVLMLAAVGGAGAARAGGATMQLTSPAFSAGAAIPRRYQDHAPPLRWSPVAGARAWAVTLQDPDAPMARPFVHWLVWNIPGAAGGLPEGGLPAGAVQGRNDAGGAGYYGPHPPSGVHHYHFKVFALDAPLALAAGAELPALTAAMRGHVLAQGELVGAFAH
ncbi:MAG: YbhB/YbcL family Raf kinase inhibitor-like protein [Caulobacteraceae bacterium]|nr:YbhB/YbcL family Raf kinase inhibitor-like protein [Caulobacteraceae bacterium]